MRGTELTVVEFATRIGIAGLLGITIGFERAWRQKRAGLHTDSLIAIGAALFTILDTILPGDNTRIIAGIVTGVGFLGGGVIFRTEMSVTGINTAATMWATAAIGALAGFGLWWEAALGAVGVVVFNMILERLEPKVAARARQARDTIYKLTILCKSETQPAVGRAVFEDINQTEMVLAALTHHNAENDRTELRAEIFSPRAEDQRIERLATRLLTVPGVESADWRGENP